MLAIMLNMVSYFEMILLKLKLRECECVRLQTFVCADAPLRLMVLKNGEKNISKALAVVGPDLTTVSCFYCCINYTVKEL